MRRLLFACAALGVLSATTMAQSTFKAYTQPAETGQDSPTDLSLAVSKDRVVLVGNDRWHIADKAGNPKITVGTGLATPLPLVDKLASSTGVFDPKAEYDVVHDRIVIVMSEQSSTPIVHVMVSKAGAVPDDFSDTYWHIYTGDGTVSGTAGAAFTLLRNPPSMPGGLDGQADHPTVAIDDDYLYLCIRDLVPPIVGPLRQTAVVFPLVHSGGDLYAGNRVAETEISFLDFDTIGPLRPDPDESTLHGSVMETTPFTDDYQFFITTNEAPGTGTTLHQFIRLGVLIETAPPSGGAPATFDYQFVDMAVPGVASFFDANRNGHRPITPGISDYLAPVFSKIETAVRHRDVAGNDYIHAVHEYQANVGGSAVNDFTTRWYKIDPDLADIGTTGWASSIIRTDVLPQPAHQDTYHSAIAVNNLAKLGVSWTRSDATTYPQMEYGIYNPATSTLTQGVHSTGPAATAPWDDQDHPAFRWADYADIQLDPNGCRFWAACTLIGTTPGSVPGTIEDRDAWIGTIPFNCFTTDMNMSGFTDTYDLMMYADYFTTGDTRADTNADGEARMACCMLCVTISTVYRLEISGSAPRSAPSRPGPSARAGLIQQQHFWIRHDRPGDAQPLLLPARQAQRRAFSRSFTSSHRPPRAAPARTPRRAPPRSLAVDPQRVDDVLEDGHGEGVGLLEDHAQPLAPARSHPRRSRRWSDP